MEKPVILIVDDETDARSTIRNFLECRYDCEFKEASDGDEAVEFVRAHRCDVMLLDIKMPKKSGMVVVKEAKELKPDVDILIISGWASEEVVEDAIEAGATDYVVKPSDLKILSLKFEQILEKRGQGLRKKRPGQ